MPQVYILDKVLKVGVLYRSEPDKAYVVKAAGTDSTTKATLTVEGAPVLETVNRLGMPEARDVERFPPLDLQVNFVVVPPDKVFSFTGASGSKMRIMGDLLSLAPGEVLPSAQAARYAEQAKKYYTYSEGVNGIGESASWADGAEYDIVTFTAPAGERHVFNRYAYVERTGVIADDPAGVIALRFYVNDRPLDVHDPDKAPLGIDTLRGHWYTAAISYLKPFPVDQMPITLEPGHSLRIAARNISGAAITTGVGEEAKVKVAILHEKSYL